MSILALLIYKYSVEVVSRDLLITTRTNSRFTVAVDLRFKLFHIDGRDRLFHGQDSYFINRFTVEAAMTGMRVKDIF